MKFKPENHIIGKAYDLTQENMQAMIIEIERLNEEREYLFRTMLETQERITMLEGGDF